MQPGCCINSLVETTKSVTPYFRLPKTSSADGGSKTEHYARKIWVSNLCERKITLVAVF